LESTIIPIIIAIITLLGSNEAWKYYEKKLVEKRRIEQEYKKEEHLYREDLRARVSNLEALLIESTKEKSKMFETIITLTGKVASLTTKVEHLERENDRLRG